jgi:hypothetical protein
MASDERSEKAETGMVPDVANLGIIRPPLLYLGTIALGLLLHFAWPVRLVSRAVSMPLGGTAVLGAVALLLSAVRTFRTAGTPVPGNRPTTTIVRTGPYRWSRNPIYLSVFLAAPARRRLLGQQSLAPRHSHASGGADVVRGHPARGALPGEPLPVGLLALQGFCASLAVTSRRTRAWS